jgi:hypothetical protein
MNADDTHGLSRLLTLAAVVLEMFARLPVTPRANARATKPTASL